jgi:hypothetical protein
MLNTARPLARIIIFLLFSVRDQKPNLPAALVDMATIGGHKLILPFIHYSNPVLPGRISNGPVFKRIQRAA